MKSEILKILRESSAYVSGQELCQKLGVSRTAVWKTIQQIKADGYEVEAAPNKGYRIAAAPEDPLNESEIKSRLKSGEMGCHVYFKEEVDSTNTWAKKLAEEGAASGTLVCADMQTKGKGRRGRRWESPRGSSLYMTLILRPDILPRNASALTLVMGLSAAEALCAMTGLKAEIKWPNDVLVSEKKICGILTEMSAQIDYVEYIIVGVGINVNRTDFPEELAGMATSAELELGHKISRADLAARVLEKFELNYQIFLKTGDMSGLRQAYDGLLANRNRLVKVMTPGESHEGTALGINDKGELLVECPGHKIREVYAGEVSIRGSRGYI
ncbi:MAG: biotin--[acetyl-CoA-carboxylase] ligase [Ruminococcus sp.]|jgi:BirA family biotin operon repressor/biotin-[acetyl-CoA-carboxylase] ligase